MPTLRVQVDLPNAEGLLRPGMQASVRISALRGDTLVPAVPTEAVETAKK